MRFRNSRVRTKVTALLLSLTALWAFAAWVTLREGVNLLWVAVYNQGVGQPGESLLAELQTERRLSVVRLGNPGLVPREKLNQQRARTDAAAKVFRTEADSDNMRIASGPALKQRIAETFQQLDALSPSRAAMDAGRVDRTRLVTSYSDMIESVFRAYDSLATLDDDQVAKDTRTLIQVNRARELLAQEDALLAGVMAAGRFTGAEHLKFSQLVGAQRYYTSLSIVDLPEADLEAYQNLTKSAKFTRLRELEERVMQSGWSQSTPPVSADDWTPVAGSVLTARIDAIHNAATALVDRATSVSIGVVVRLLLAGVLGLVAVIASIVLSITTARHLVNQLEKLRTAALELANERLPSVVARLAHGEKVDVAIEAPHLDFGGDVIGQVGQAFNAVQETAVRTAVEEAQLRQSIRDILLSLARRTQSLVHRQLTLLDTMERRETDEAGLKDLFRVDHLATRMRRNAENLIVLSGASPARAWRRSVPMVDVVRGALAEVEDYTRVTVLPMGQVELTGRAVGDVIHLLAELIENAVSFSPPYTMVQVGGQMVANGYAIEIEDRGLGMTREDLDTANERIADPPEFNLSSTARLGLYVVSRLAERHGIAVSLKSSPYGGTTAVILLPHELVVQDAKALPVEGGAVGPDGTRVPNPRNALVGGRHAAAEATDEPEEFSRPEHMPLHGQSRGAQPLAELGPLSDPYGSLDRVVPFDQTGPFDRPPLTDSTGPFDRVPFSERSPLPERPVSPERSMSADRSTPPDLPLMPDATGPFDRPPLPERRPNFERPQSFERSGSFDRPSLPERKPAAVRDSTPTGPEPSRPASEPSFTPSGLPFRVPQAHLAAPLRDEAPVVDEDDDERSPEEIRKIMGSFQTGTQRGRSEAARLLRGGTHSADEENNQ